MNEAETRAEHICPNLCSRRPEQIAQAFSGFQKYLYEKEQAFLS